MGNNINKTFRQRLASVGVVGDVLHNLRVVFTNNSFPLLRQLLDILHPTQHIACLFPRCKGEIGSNDADGVSW